MHCWLEKLTPFGVIEWLTAVGNKEGSGWACDAGHLLLKQLLVFLHAGRNGVLAAYEIKR